MINNARATELFEVDIDRLISVGRKQGLSYWQILKVFLACCVTLQMQADVEYYLKGGH